MSTSIGSSSSLNKLERYNHSKSTVSSSDIDASSAGYASSSGTTTPEDDAQTFYLGPTIHDVLAGTPKRGPREKLTIVTRRRTLSSAMKKVKKVAYALAVFKKKRPDDISPIFISSPLRERFGKRMSVKPHPEESFYSLPNRRFSLSDVNTPPCEKQPRTITRKFGTISGSMSSTADDTSKKQHSGLRMPSFSSSRRARPPTPAPTAVPRAAHDASMFRRILLQGLRVVLFVPWCAAVGGALLLFPNHVESVAFGMGYLPSPRGLRRFAHWADCGRQHVMIFLACLVAVLWYDCALGLSVGCVVVSRAVFVWYGFRVDKRIPLGEDDQQSIYLVMMGLMAEADSFVRPV